MLFSKCINNKHKYMEVVFHHLITWHEQWSVLMARLAFYSNALNKEIKVCICLDQLTYNLMYRSIKRQPPALLNPPSDDNTPAFAWVLPELSHKNYIPGCAHLSVCICLEPQGNWGQSSTLLVYQKPGQEIWASLDFVTQTFLWKKIDISIKN